MKRSQGKRARSGAVLAQVKQMLDLIDDLRRHDWDTYHAQQAALEELRAVYELLDGHIGVSGHM